MLHVVDITHETAAEQSQTVEDILNDLGLDSKPRLLVLNKIDLLIPNGSQWEGEGIAHDADQLMNSDQAVVISAAMGWGLRTLLDRIAEMLGSKAKQP